MKSCLSCIYALRVAEAFDAERYYCNHPEAEIEGEPVGCVTGEEALRCGFYKAGTPDAQDDLVTVILPAVPVHAQVPSLLRAGN